MKRYAAFLVLAIAAVAVLGLIFWWPPAGAPTTVDIDDGVRFQTIDGWAVYPRYWEDDKIGDRFDRSFEPYTEAVSQVLVNDVGINSVRVEIWSGLENPVDYWLPHYEGDLSYEDYAPVRYEKVNDNDDPYSVDPAGFQFSKFDHRMEVMILPIKRAVEARGEKLHINVNYVDFSWGARRGRAASTMLKTRKSSPSSSSSFLSGCGTGMVSSRIPSRSYWNRRIPPTGAGRRLVAG